MNRNDRRAQRKALLGGVASHPVSRRLLANHKKYGRQAAEIFVQNDDGTGQARYFDVFSARLWCSKHGEIVTLVVDPDLAMRLESGDAIDPDHLATKSFDEDVSPVILCRRASPYGDQLIDGAHRYVAFVRALRDEGLEGTGTTIPAYILEPATWTRFVVPTAVAKAFRFDEQRNVAAPDV